MATPLPRRDNAHESGSSQNEALRMRNYMILIKGRSRRLTGGYPRTTIPVRGCATRMATMEAFDTVLNWKLQRGSHPFPSPDGGTCINEAAIVAAGFSYQPVHLVGSCQVAS